MGYFVSVVNNKGGVGKTTTTCNLADVLGKQGNKVLVLDVDPQCNSSTILLPRETQIRKSFYDILENNESLDLTSYIYATMCKNVFVLPNISDSASLEPALIAQAPDSFLKLRNAIRNKTTQDYNYVIIDCPPNMGTFVLCALYASDFAIVPIKAGSTFSVEGLIRAVQLIKDVREKGNADLKFLRLLINCIDRRTSISQAVTGQLENIFNSEQIFKTQIPINTAFEKAESQRATIFQYDGTSTGARAFRELGKELSSILGA